MVVRCAPNLYTCNVTLREHGQTVTLIHFNLFSLCSELETRFMWLVSHPFVLEPPAGTLSPKSKCSILATFKPTAARVYEMVGECHFGEDLSHKKSLRLEGIGKCMCFTIKGTRQYWLLLKTIISIKTYLVTSNGELLIV